jgi:hypothetical protein
MHNLNLFGVTLDSKEDAKEAASSKESQEILTDLINMVEQVDDNLVNFNIRKSWVYYDVYNTFTIIHIAL